MAEEHSPNITSGVIRNHRVPYIQDLRLADNLFHSRFSSSCSMSKCPGSCCKFGVYVDLAHRDTILANADLIREQMDNQQERDEHLWFEDKIYDDPDFPSGKAIGTRAMWYGCAFLDVMGKCVLQKASVELGQEHTSLKPFYCIAYPVTIHHGQLMFDEENFLNSPNCCRPTPGGSLNVLDVCEEELLFVLGPEGLAEFRELMKIENSRRHE